MTNAVSAHETTMTRVFDAPREAVWRAWTDPAELAAWWGPEGWSTPAARVVIEARPGGIFRATSVSEEHGEMTSEGVFREVVEFERLVLEEHAEDAWHEGAVSVVTLTDLRDGRTRLVLRSIVNTTPEGGAQMEAGVAGSLDRLAELLA